MVINNGNNKKMPEQRIKKIVMVGAECSGKTTLAQELAKKFQTEWVPEYARTYLALNGANYQKHDLLNIAKKQNLIEKESINKAHHYVFCDTNALVIQVWSEFVFGEVDPLVLSLVQHAQVDLYVLCHYDIPYEWDVLRENPNKDDRMKIHNRYKFLLEQFQYPFIEVLGTIEERLNFIEKKMKVL
jgi:NadR type nicotinamide-nucleotide adenylyltransferase